VKGFVNKKYGIVLRSFFPYKRKISVITKCSGKINIVVRAKRLCPLFSAGTFIKFYSGFSVESCSFAHDVEVVVVPMPNMEQLCWLHNLLEICYFFLPLNSPCSDVFYFLKSCFEYNLRIDDKQKNFDVFKKTCLVKLFMLLGFQPDRDLVLFGNLFDTVVQGRRCLLTFLDSIDDQKVESLGEISGLLLSKIDRWIMHCLQEHPNIASFKTINLSIKSLKGT
jgi:hypothetical protein